MISGVEVGLFGGFSDLLMDCAVGGGLVHQEGLSMNEKILRHFDLSSQYGVSFSLLKLPLTRLGKWAMLNDWFSHASALRA